MVENLSSATAITFGDIKISTFCIMQELEIDKYQGFTVVRKVKYPIFLHYKRQISKLLCIMQNLKAFKDQAFSIVHHVKYKFCFHYERQK